MKQVDILSTIDSYELGKICDSLKVGIFKKDDYIIKEGEFGDVFYIIEEGKCKATKTLEPGKPEEIINELKEGDYFGERALLRGEPRYANIVVVSDTAKVISLDRLSFNRLLGPIMDILKRNMDKYTAYCQPNNNGKLTNLKDILSSDNNIKDTENNRNNVIEINKNEDINEINEENDKDINKNIDSQINVNNNLNELIKSDNMINNNNNDSIEIQKENIIEEKDDIINEEKKEDNIESNNNDNQNGQNNLNSLQEMIVSKDNNDESPKNDEQ